MFTLTNYKTTTLRLFIFWWFYYGDCHPIKEILKLLERTFIYLLDNMFL